MCGTPIEFLSDSRTFFLHAKGTTYAFKVLERGCLAHLYWGPSLAAQSLDFALCFRDRAFSPNPSEVSRDFSLDVIRQEYPVYGNTDFRSPAVEVFQPADGSRIVDLRYKTHTIAPGKPLLEGLPATYVESEAEATTLTVTLEDAKLGLTVELLYTVFTHLPVITRSVRLVNGGAQPLEIERVLSCSVDFSSAQSGYEFLHLSGAWARERDLYSIPLHQGIQSIESRRGASSHQHNPFFALAEHGTDEDRGFVFGFNLVYSGNFLGSAERDPYGVVRAQLGVNPFDFAWHIAPGESFQAPEAVLVFSVEGLGGMSRAFHRLYQKHICRGSWRDKERPILVNNWEATYFDFDIAKLKKIAAAGADLGIELFVLDDGWFGRRNSDNCSLGDWVVDQKKIPGGLEDLVAKIRTSGMAFGLWFEPEMVSPDSDLYRAHPDWCLHVPDRPRSAGRNQLVLDFSRADVREEIFRQMASILESVPITYVKWDMNRHMTEIGSAALPPSRQRETAHRYMLGLYELLERLTRAFPDVLFESCSGGGGRFDSGMLHYMPQVWTSDNSDAISRLRIQYGTSVVYPQSAMAAHVSVVPNHQVGRVTPLRTRGEVAFTGAFGYELDLSLLGEAERTEIRRQVSLYKKLRPLLIRADFFRLRSPFETNEAAWMAVSPEKDEALVTHVTILAEPLPPQSFLRLKGLDPAGVYNVNDSETFCGDVLMQFGLPVPWASGDFQSCQWHLRRI